STSLASAARHAGDAARTYRFGRTRRSEHDAFPRGRARESSVVHLRAARAAAAQDVADPGTRGRRPARGGEVADAHRGGRGERARPVGRRRPEPRAACRDAQLRRADARRVRHGLLAARAHGNRSPRRPRHRRRRPDGHPARHPHDHPGLRRGRRRGRGQRHPGRDDRPLAPDGRPGLRLGPPNGHNHPALDLGVRKGGCADLTEPLPAADERGLETLRVLIVDDHDLFRTGLRNLLEEQGVQVSGEAATGADAVRSVREIAPDVVVMDLNMPGMGGVEATRHIAAIAPLTRVVVLTISDEDADVMDAILAGACGYLLKDSSIDELMAGIRAAWRGESLISPGIAAKVLQRVRATSAQPEIADTIRSELSDREIEVLKLIANGKDNAVIAAELHISPKTVKNHISNILMKLQIDNRIQAAVYAVRSGIV